MFPSSISFSLFFFSPASSFLLFVLTESREQRLGAREGEGDGDSWPGSRSRVRRHRRLRRSRSRKNVAGGRLCGWVGEKPEKIYCPRYGVRGRRQKKNILPARWGAWPAREKKNYISPAGEMGCVAGDRKKIIIYSGRRDRVRGRQGKKNLICRRDYSMSGGEKNNKNNK
jgi:hypothetical protein